MFFGKHYTELEMIFPCLVVQKGFPGGSAGKESVGKISWRRERLNTEKNGFN